MIFDRVERFGLEHALNFYQRAAFGNTFKWALRDAGYAPAVVDGWTGELVTYLTLKSKLKK